MQARLWSLTLASITDNYAKRCSMAWPRDLSKSNAASIPVLSSSDISKLSNSLRITLEVNPEESRKDETSTDALTSPSSLRTQASGVFNSADSDLPSW